jgi:hypothetical protein
MPDALERQRVLAWLAQAHRVRIGIRTSSYAGVISGDVIAACLKSPYRAAAQPALAVDAATRRARSELF